VNANRLISNLELNHSMPDLTTELWGNCSGVAKVRAELACPLASSCGSQGNEKALQLSLKGLSL